MGRWNDDRWKQTGTNEAGDPIYERTVATPKKAAAKKPAAKKKA